MNQSYLNFAALALGLLAWILPIIRIGRQLAQRSHGAEQLTFASFACGALALWCEIKYQAHLADIEDFSAIADTVGALSIVAGVLVIGTIALNLLALLLGYRGKAQTT